MLWYIAYMIMKKKINIYHILAAALVLITCIASCVAFYYSNSRGGELLSASGIQVYASSPKAIISSSETIEVTITVSNNTNKDVTETFNCTDTEPNISINGKANISICGQAITKRTIPAHHKETFYYDINASDLKDGVNNIESSWGSYKGNKFVIEKKSISKQELSSQFAKCQSLKDDIDFNDIPGFCKSIDIILQEKEDGYTCKYWKEFVGGVGLKIPCTNVMGDGIGYIWLPKEHLEKYSEKIKNLPGVEDVSISN